MAGKKYPMKLTRLQIRNLWLDVQKAKPGNRTHEDWLAAANRELEEYAEVRIGVIKMQFLDMKKPEEVLTLVLSFEATSGCKLALVQAAKDGEFRKRCSVREAADGFGPEFSKLVRKATALEDSEDLDDDAELAGVPALEDPPAATAAAEHKEA